MLKICGALMLEVTLSLNILLFCLYFPDYRIKDYVLIGETLLILLKMDSGQNDTLQKQAAQQDKKTLCVRLRFSTGL